tara:strand:+ start:99 stop:329 length:231 start_codon:yes stop_codon:yes gene_type:complete
MSIVKRELKVVIEVDEDTIKDKYPNYESNFDTVEEFMDMIENDLDAYPNILGMVDNPMYEWGYDVVVNPFQLNKNK